MEWNKRSYYWKQTEKKIIDNNYFFESFSGVKISGEIYFAIIELSKRFVDKKMIVAISDKNDIPTKIFNLLNVEFVLKNSFKYFNALATSSYLFTDTTFPLFFKKRLDQKLIQFWHGTPIKKMGISVKSSSDFSNISNVQKTFLHSDKIILNNNWTKDILLKEFMIGKYIESKILLTSTLKNKDYKSNPKQNVNILFAYTWKTAYRKNPKLLKGKLKYIDNLIKLNIMNKKNYSFYYSLHNLIYNKKFLKWMDDNLSFIKPLRYENEIYEFMKYEADIIVSDFSSFVFDAAYFNKKIIIDFSNFNDYVKERGVYFEVINDLKNNFVYRNSIKDTVIEIFKKNSNQDLTWINEKYNEFEFSKNYWIDIIFKIDETKPVKPVKSDSTLIYPGNLALNGITTSLYNTLDLLIKNNGNITIWAPKSYISQNKAIDLYKKYDGKLQILSTNYQQKGYIDKFNEYTYRKIGFPVFLGRFNRKTVVDHETIFGNINFKNVVHFSGYEWFVNEVLSRFKSNKIYYIHNDLYLEYKYKRNFRKFSIKRGFKSYDKIVFVSKGLSEVKRKIRGLDKQKQKFTIIENPMPDYKRIKELSNNNNLDVKTSQSYLETAILKEIIKEKKITKVVSIGRIGALQKNHYTIIKSFENYKDNYNSDSVLLLMGGKGFKKDRYFIRNKLTNYKINHSRYKKDIFIFKTNNVYNILKNSDILLYNSIYEGQGLAVIEAATLGLPVIVSDYHVLKEQSIKYGHSTVVKTNDYKKIAININSNINNGNNFDVKNYNKSVEIEINKLY